MLPDSGCVMKTMGMVNAPVRKGDDHAAAAASVPGPGRAGRAGTPLPHHPRRRDPHPLPDGPAGRAGPHPTPDRHAGPAQPRHHPPGPQALPGPRSRRRAAPAPSGPAAALSARLAGRVGPGRRAGPPRGWRGQCAVDLPAAERLSGRPDRASGRVCVQAAPLGAVPQGPGAAGVGKKRLRVEALLAAAASPVPPPAHTLVPDATLAEDLVPEDLPRLLGLLGRADLYLQDEVKVALHPTLTKI